MAMGTARFVAGMLFKVTADDPVIFVGTALFLCAVALLASYVPAWRATRIDPIEALRHE